MANNQWQVFASDMGQPLGLYRKNGLAEYPHMAKAGGPVILSQKDHLCVNLENNQNINLQMTNFTE